MTANQDLIQKAIEKAYGKNYLGKQVTIDEVPSWVVKLCEDLAETIRLEERERITDVIRKYSMKGIYKNERGKISDVAIDILAEIESKDSGMSEA